MSLERAIEDQRLMDLALRDLSPVVTEHYDIVIIGSGAGGGTMARALAGTGARILILERGGVVPREAENWDPAAVWRELRYRTTEEWLDDRGPRVPAVHALQRRRQHQVLGQRAVSAAARGFRRRRTRGRHLARLADRLRHAGAVLRPRRGDVRRARRGTAPIRRSRRAGRFRSPPIPHAPNMADLVERLAGDGSASVAAAARTAAPGRSGGASSAGPATRFRAGSARRATPSRAASSPRVTRPNVDACARARRRAG